MSHIVKLSCMDRNDAYFGPFTKEQAKAFIESYEDIAMYSASILYLNEPD